MPAGQLLQAAVTPADRYLRREFVAGKRSRHAFNVTMSTAPDLQLGHTNVLWSMLAKARAAPAHVSSINFKVSHQFNSDECRSSRWAASQHNIAQTKPAHQPANTSEGQWTPR